MRKIYQILTFTMVMLLSSLVLSSAGFMPYGRMYKATQDERAYTTQAKDSRLQLQLRKSILLADPTGLLNISSFVFMEHGFLVGEVENENQSKQLVSTAGEVSELNGVSYYLPVKTKETAPETPSALDIKIKAMFEQNYPSSKLTVKVVQDVVVVLGVLTPKEQQKALSSLKKIAGVNKVINFMQAPSPDKVKRSRPRPLRNLFN